MDRPDMTNQKRQAGTPTPLVDPLMQYSREELVDLIRQQAEENQALRDQSEQFEHLYLDIIHSTSWKLAWPIRAAFKVLTLGKDKLKNRKSRKTSQMSTNTTRAAETREAANFDADLPQLLFFTSPSSQTRLNLLVSQHLTPPHLSAIITPLAQLAAQQQIALRVISLDPALTARHCLSSIAPSGADQNQLGNFVFHSLILSQSSRSPFRIEIGTREMALSLTRAADQAMALMLPEGQRRIIDPGQTNWHAQLEAMLRHLPTGGQP
ncbi:MAG: hypothetical protein EOM08_09815 [Clostridia bacterium]|nr:hypothetical protein [Clostridia bacterium]